jgi:hypothetical protein
MGTPDYSRRLEYAFKANAWRILDRSLDLAQKQAGKSGSWHGASIDPAGGACPVGLAGRDDDAPWLLDAEDQSKTAALREVGNVAAPKGPVPTDLLKVLVRHRGPPLRAGEDALQRLFAYALTQRRMDIVETISAQVEGRFEWCSGGVSTRDLVDAIRPSRRGQVWKDGETTLFRAIASWPPEHWHEVAGAYLRQIVYGDSPSQAEALATCRSAAARIAALRPGADRTSLIDICKAS